MVNIKLDEKMSITSDTNQYMLREFKGIGKSGLENYEVIGYFSTLAGALKDYIENTLRESECSSLKEILELHEQLVEKVGKLIKI